MERDKGQGRPEGAPKEEDRAPQKEQGKPSPDFSTPQGEQTPLEEIGGEVSAPVDLPRANSTSDIPNEGQDEQIKSKKPCPRLPFPGGSVCILYGPKNRSKK
jgi:hypothetical protein